VLFGLLLVAVVSRYLGVAGMGRFALVFAYVAIVAGVVTDIGLGTVCLREVAQRPAETGAILGSAAALQGLVAIGSYGLILGGLPLLPFAPEVRTAIAIYGLSVLLTPLDLLATPFTARLQLSRTVLPALAGTILNFALTLAVVAVRGPLWLLVAAALAAAGAQSGFLLARSLRLLAGGLRLETRRWRGLLRESLPLAAGTVLTAVQNQSPVLLLGLFGAYGPGLFNAAQRIPQQLLVLPIAVRSTTFPLLAETWTGNRPRFRRLLQRLLEVALLISVPTSIAGAALAGPIVTTVFGTAFAPAAPVFAVLMALFALLFPGILLGEAMIAAGQQRVNVGIQFVSLALLGGLLLALAPHGGALGAAIAVVLTYGFQTIATLAAAMVRLGGLDVGRLAAGMLAGVLGAAALLLLQPVGFLPAGAIAVLIAGAGVALSQRRGARDLWSLARGMA